MHDVKALDRGRSVEESLTNARHAANIGDTSHTILHAQEAVCLSFEALTDEIAELRRALTKS